MPLSARRANTAACSLVIDALPLPTGLSAAAATEVNATIRPTAEALMVAFVVKWLWSSQMLLAQFAQRFERGLGLIVGVEEATVRKAVRGCIAEIGPVDSADVRLA